MLISVNSFLGEFPKMHPRTLPASAAQTAVNARLDNGILSPLSGSTFVTDLVTPRKTVYLDGTTWLAWDTAVNVVPGPTATDRLYITGDGPPKMMVDDNEYPLALPAPGAALTTATVTAPDPEEIETVLYAYTWVTSFGEESAPSPLSAPLSWSEGVVARLTGFGTPPAGRGVTNLRIYRSVTSELGATDLYFVAETGIISTYDHDLEADPIGEPISTKDHATPPATLKGIIAMPNGMMVGHTARALHFCEPYQPHTWPVKYSLTVDYDIVGLAAFGSQLAVMTKGTPYRGQGYHPESFSLEKIEENLPCMSKRGIVDLGYAAAYPSTDGLVLVTSTTSRVVTTPLFSRKQWSKLNPASMVASHLGGRYFFAFTGTLPGSSAKTGIIDLTGETPFLIRSDVTMRCAYHDIRTGTLYVQDADNILYKFDDPDSTEWRDQVWRSKVHDLSFEVGFAAALFEGEEIGGPGSFSADIIADGVTIHTVTEMNKIVRLPAVQAQHWEFRIEGKVGITSASLATSMAELAVRP